MSFLEDDEFEAPVPDRFVRVEVARPSIGMVHGVVQVVQNWFTGIPNSFRSSRLR